MTTLVMGGTGFIGLRAVRKLAERGEKVVCLDINPQAADFSDLGDMVTIVAGDVTRFEDVMRPLVLHKCDRILNLAYRLVGGNGEPHLATRINVNGTDNCFEAGRLLGIGHIVFASTIGVYGEERHFGDRLLTEDDELHGTALYSMCKRFNEYMADLYRKNYGLTITTIRPANVTGPDKVRGSVDHVNCMTKPARGEPVRFPGNNALRALIHVEDMAELFARVTLCDKPQHTTYNSGGHLVTLGELAEAVRKVVPDADITFAAETAHLPGQGAVRVDYARVRDEFGVPYRSVDEIVRSVVAAVRAG